MNDNKLIFFAKYNDKNHHLERLYITDCVFDLIHEIKYNNLYDSTIKVYCKNSSIIYDDNDNCYYININEKPILLYELLFSVDVGIKLKFNYNIFNFTQIDFSNIIDDLTNDKDINFLFEINDINNFMENISNSNIYNEEQINLIYLSIYENDYTIQLSNTNCSREEFCAIMDISLSDIVEINDQ